MEPTELALHVASDLAASGLPEDGSQYGFEPIAAEYAAAFLRTPAGEDPGAGMAIHYKDWAGNQLALELPDSPDGHPYCRVKPLVAYKGAKYLSPCGLENQLYIPDPRVIEMAKEVGYLVVTEGEKKAASATHRGIPTVGIVGPWGGFKPGSTELLTPLFEECLDRLQGSRVTLVFTWDSDAACNLDFAQASLRYVRLLHKRDQGVKILVLPQTTVRKVGLDDLLVGQGVEHFLRLLDSALIVEPASDFQSLQHRWMEGLNELEYQAENPEENLRFLRNCFSRGFCHSFARETQRRLLRIFAEKGFHQAPRVLAEVVRETVAVMNSASLDKQAAEDDNPGPGRPRKTQTPPPLASSTLYVFGDNVWFSDDVGQADKVGYAWLWDPQTDLRRLVLATSLQRAKSFRDERAVQFYLRREHWLPDAMQASLVSYGGKFYTYENERWRPADDLLVKASVQKAFSSIPNLEKGMATVETVMSALATHPATHVPVNGGPAALWNGTSWVTTQAQLVLTNCRMEIMDAQRNPLDEPVIHRLTPDFFHANPLPIVYDPRATCPLWHATLDLFTPDTEYQAFIQEVYGILFLSETVKALFLLLGTGNNGKGTFGYVATHLVGSGNITSVRPEDIASRFEGLPLTRASLNFLGDAPVGALDTEAKSTVMKLVTGDDPVHFNVKNSTSSIDRIVTAKIWMCFNSLQPTIADRSQGMRDRVVILPFEKRIDPKDADPNFKNRLVTEELSGIFNWALVGLMRYLRNGRHFSRCRVVEEATRAYWEDTEASLGFVESCLTSSPGTIMTEDFLWNHFTKYCAERNVSPCTKKALFSRVLGTVPGATEGRKHENGPGSCQRRTICGVDLAYGRERRALFS